MTAWPVSDPLPDGEAPLGGARRAGDRVPVENGRGRHDRRGPEIEIIRRRPHRPSVIERDRPATVGAIRAVGDAGACPLVEQNHAACSRRLRLGSIDDAFAYCFGGYRGCSTFRHLTGSAEGDGEPPAPVRLTVHGHAVRGSARAGTA